MKNHFLYKVITLGQSVIMYIMLRESLTFLEKTSGTEGIARLAQQR